MGGLRVSNEVILVKTESSYNTDPTPATSANEVLVRNINLSQEGLRMIDRAAVRAGLGKLKRIYGGELRRITFECEVKGSGAAGTAPEIGPLLEACGFEETVSASTSVTYATENATHESVTIYFFEGGRKRHILTGCRGNVRFGGEAGGILIAYFDLVGHYTQATDQSQPTPTYDSTVPVALIGKAVGVNGVTALTIKSWEWNMNNTVAMPASMAATDGYGELIISERDPRGQVVLESELDSVLDIDSLIAAGTLFAFTSAAIGGTAGNIVTLTTASSSTYMEGTDMGEDSGLRTRTINLGVDDSVGQPQIVFT